SFINFFFQAEDGIRDYKVTGVQTCALPISSKLLLVRRRSEREARGCDGECVQTCRQHASQVQVRNENRGAHPRRGPAESRNATRSEERRVGKESRYQSGPDHEKKKKKEKTG